MLCKGSSTKKILRMGSPGTCEELVQVLFLLQQFIELDRGVSLDLGSDSVEC
jgi:hypothetical protein